MTVKELKELLNEADDDTVVVLYDGVDEGDAFVTTAIQIKRENYIGYCQGDSCLDFEDGDGPDKVFVLAGWGASYDALNECKNENLHEISNGPEAEVSRKKAEAQRLAKMAKEREEREKHQQELAEIRKCRFCLNYCKKNFYGYIEEFNSDSIEEIEAKIKDLRDADYTVYDRHENRRIMHHES